MSYGGSSFSGLTSSCSSAVASAIASRHDGQSGVAASTVRRPPHRGHRESSTTEPATHVHHRHRLHGNRPSLSTAVVLHQSETSFAPILRALVVIETLGEPVHAVPQFLRRHAGGLVVHVEECA